MHVHLVFVTKYRRGVRDDAMLRLREATMRKVRADFSAELREFNGEADHVHLLIEYRPKTCVSALVNSLKGVSARRLRAEFTGPVNRASMHGHSWSPFALRRVLRRRTAEQHPPVDRAATGPGLTAGPG